ncbi:putative ER lumen protein retaining receptor [Aureobasidium pullulans]|nr:putative ER lumen protein retaining receptor [Aureobasidium pullulans]
MNIFRILGDLSHLFSVLILLHKMKTSSSASGISFKSQFLYLIVYVTRYIDLLWQDPFKILWNTTFKLVFIGTSSYIIYLMLNDYKPTHDPNLDTFRVQYLVAGSAVLGILFPYKYTPSEMLWAFSIWLEAVAILPQLFMLQRTGEAETITTHYLFALGAYRALYIPNWIYRWFTEGWFEPISVIAGLVQTVLYSDFFYIYYTKVFQDNPSVALLAKLSDFGVCIDMSDHKIGARDYRGTDSWLGPEARNSHPEYDDTLLGTFQADHLKQFDSFSYGMLLLALFVMSGGDAPNLDLDRDDLEEQNILYCAGNY